MLTRNGKTYFTENELKCKGSGGIRLAPGFGEKLLDLRIAFDGPMIVTSCCRSKKYNAEVGGSRGSYHVYDEPFHDTGGTCAIDIATSDSRYRARLIGLALSMGWSVGVNRTFVHLDRRIDYGISKENLLFLY